MTLFTPAESDPGETRAALVPEHAAKLVKLGVTVQVESGLGQQCGWADVAYTAIGATICTDRKTSLSGADVVLRLRPPVVEEVSSMKPGAILVSYLDPFRSPDLIQALAESGISSVCMELIPRTTRAQKMDALSSQASLAGYAAVVLAAQQCDKIFPMMMTPAGTILPAKVFIIGAGVAGLQAIATARRLGAKVEAYDTRPIVEEQVRSLGAKFVKIDLGQTGQTKEGYAQALTEEQIQRQRAGMKKLCTESDVVITTAQVFGRRAPILVTTEMLDAMRPGSVVVDLAVEGGGNVEGIVPDQIVERRGVRLVGISSLPGCVPVHASQMYSSNVTSFVEEYWDREAKCLKLNLEDDIVKGALVTHGGVIINDKLKPAAT